MSEKTIVHEFDQNVTYNIDQVNYFKSKRALNMHHVNTEIIPLSVKTEDIPDVLCKAHDKMRLPIMVKLHVVVYSDGSRKITLID